MSIVTDSEVGALEDRLANLIHTHQGEIAEQRYAYGTKIRLLMTNDDVSICHMRRKREFKN